MRPLPLKAPRTSPPPPNPETAPVASRPNWLRRARTRTAAFADKIVAPVGHNRHVKRALTVVAIANESGAPLFAAALAFGTLFAVIPLVLLLSGLIGWLIEDPLQRQALLSQLVSYFPPLADLFERSLDGAVAQRGALSIVGVVGLLWGASAYYGGLDETMSRLFPGGRPRGEFARRLRGLVTIAVLLLLIVGTISLSGVWGLLDQLVSGLLIWRYVAPLLALAVMIPVVLAAYLLVPSAPPSLRAAGPPAIAAGLGIGLLTNVFSLLAPLLIGWLSAFGVIATVFGALVWLNFSYQILLFGAAWARLRRDHERRTVRQSES